MIDDSEGVVGFEMPAFALNLEVEPPPTAPPLVQTVTVPVPVPEENGDRDGARFELAAREQPGKTGKRAAALAKCN